MPAKQRRPARRQHNRTSDLSDVGLEIPFHLKVATTDLRAERFTSYPPQPPIEDRLYLDRNVGLQEACFRRGMSMNSLEKTTSSEYLRAASRRDHQGPLSDR
jgi:hypothetical protein